MIQPNEVADYKDASKYSEFAQKQGAGIISLRRVC